MNPPAFYKTGYFGIHQPGRMKMFRSGQFVPDPEVTDALFTIHCYMIEHENYPFATPREIDKGTVALACVPVNLKGRLLAWKIEFPAADVACGVMELSCSHFEISDR